MAEESYEELIEATRAQMMSEDFGEKCRLAEQRRLKRARRIEIDGNSLVGLLKQGLVFGAEKNGLPVDAQLRSAEYDSERRQFLLCVTSEQFDEVPEGTVIPLHPAITMKDMRG